MLTHGIIATAYAILCASSSFKELQSHYTMRYAFIFSVIVNLYLSYFIAKRFYYGRIPPILWNYELAMIGDSHVYRGDWKKLLGRSVANFGKGKDSLQGMYNRLPGLLNCKPKVCFIHGGINDIANDIPIDTTLKYYRLIIDRLNKAGIEPVIIPVMKPAYPDFDNRINELNARIIKLGNVLEIDITKDDLQKDGIHMDGSGYAKWALGIDQYLSKK